MSYDILTNTILPKFEPVFSSIRTFRKFFQISSISKIFEYSRLFFHFFQIYQRFHTSRELRKSLIMHKNSYLTLKKNTICDEFPIQENGKFRTFRWIFGD
ncbi:MAG: hypothetical protein D6732_22740 [Methanobacteriota archaeon]|nr:MAG: hypothetical protein D6732_22740 [Euryarchaeota archaeon]